MLAGTARSVGGEAASMSVCVLLQGVVANDLADLWSPVDFQG